MLVKCYTINKNGVASGIRASDYESVVSTADDVDSVKIHMVPVMPCEQNLSVGTAAISVSFLIAETGDCSKDGAVLSFDPDEWRLCSVDTKLILLDPCGETGRVLVYVEKSSGEVLASVHDACLYLELSADGVPIISKHQRASMLLKSLCPGANIPQSAAHLQAKRKSSKKVAPCSDSSAHKA